MMDQKKPSYINCRGKLVDVSKPLIMGILNLTPDSFYDGGKYAEKLNQEGRIRQMVEEGMDILDIGAYSSRPGAAHISTEEEWSRLEPVLTSVNKNFNKLPVSVDTFRSEIAKRAVRDFGVSIVNDISAGSLDPNLLDTVAELQVPYILMHMQGDPQTMQKNPEYEDLMTEITEFFSNKIQILLEKGIRDIIIDPGFGFGKTLDQNYEILGRLEDFKIFNLPLLVGISRKSMIYKFLDQEPSEALAGTIALQVLALEKGAGIIRTHDVAAADICRKMVEKVSGYQ